MSTEKKVIDLIAAKAGLGSDDTIKTSHDLRNDLNLDSLDIVELWMDFEKEFNIEVSDEMVEGLTDVQSVIDVIESVLSAFTNKK